MSKIKNVEYGHMNWGPFVMRTKLPDYIIKRKKKGFNPPTLEWIKFSSNSINNFLKEDNHDNSLKPILVYCKFLLKQSLMGNLSSSNKLWTILVFLRWNQKINN